MPEYSAHTLPPRRARIDESLQPHEAWDIGWQDRRQHGAAYRYDAIPEHCRADYRLGYEAAADQEPKE